MARKRVVDVIANATLSKNQSNSLVTLGTAGGLTITLPNKGRGLEYDFVVKTSLTSGTMRIVGNDSASMKGSVLVSSAAGASYSYVADGITHMAISMVTTSGGQIGTHLKLICDNDGVWNVTGKAVGTESKEAASDVFATS